MGHLKAERLDRWFRDSSLPVEPTTTEQSRSALLLMPAHSLLLVLTRPREWLRMPESATDNQDGPVANSIALAYALSP